MNSDPELRDIVAYRFPDHNLGPSGAVEHDAVPAAARLSRGACALDGARCVPGTAVTDVPGTAVTDVPGAAWIRCQGDEIGEVGVGERPDADGQWVICHDLTVTRDGTFSVAN